MRTRTKVLIVASAAVVAAGAIATAGVATGFDDRPLEGSDLERATEAALASTGGGRVIETEAGDDGASYGVEVQLDDGSVVEVELDERFQVIGSAADDDSMERSDETEDDS